MQMVAMQDTMLTLYFSTACNPTCSRSRPALSSISLSRESRVLSCAALRPCFGLAAMSGRCSGGGSLDTGTWLCFGVTAICSVVLNCPASRNTMIILVRDYISRSSICHRSHLCQSVV